MRTILTTALALIAAPAFAHEGDHTHMTSVEGARHALTSPDHLLMVGMIAALIALPASRLVLRHIRR
jgi:hydrogenase/urease accessory protein HupE